MHETSDTMPSPLGGWWNVYGAQAHGGRAGSGSPLTLPFESLNYSSPEVASDVAAARSNLFGMLMNATNQQTPQAKQLGLPTPWVGPPPTPYDMYWLNQHSRDLPSPIYDWTSNVPKTGQEIGVLEKPGQFKSGEPDLHPELTRELQRRALYDNYDINQATPLFRGMPTKSPKSVFDDIKKLGNPKVYI